MIHHPYYPLKDIQHNKKEDANSISSWKIPSFSVFYRAYRTTNSEATENKRKKTLFRQEEENKSGPITKRR